jgi:hypothetical protein
MKVNDNYEMINEDSLQLIDNLIIYLKWKKVKIRINTFSMGAIDEAEKLLNINKNDFEIQFEENIFII